MALTEKLFAEGVVPVFSVEDAGDAVPVVRALERGGIGTAEITFRTSAAAEAIASVRRDVPGALIGAGTVLTVSQVKEAVSAGASFIVSPGLNPDVTGYCVEQRIPVIPGCSCAGDIERALSFGLTHVKFFPAEALGGTAMIKALSAPYAQVRFMPTGGVRRENLAEYVQCPSVFAVGGTWIVPKDAVAARDWDRIESNAREAVTALHGFDLAHFGVNSGDPEKALRDARLFASLFGWQVREGNSSDFAGTRFEFMKKPFYGTHGHIAISVYSVERAAEYFRRRGFAVNEATAGYKNGKLNAVYLEGEFAGYAIHLIRK